MQTFFKHVARRIPLVSRFVSACRWYRNTRELMWVPPGHFYSPIPSREDRERFERQAGLPAPPALPGIDLNESGQLQLLSDLARYGGDQPYGPEQAPGLRYIPSGRSYPLGDAMTLHCMLRHLRPRRIIEIGCGLSSAVILDANEHYLGGALDCTFIDPDHGRLLPLLKPADHERARLIERRLQDVSREQFARLQSGDILFVDSSHVVKLGSELNTILFEILPRLAEGVYVHFHDIFYPFEYPPEWVREGRAWNESYLLRAFLSFNSTFAIALFFTYLSRFHVDCLRSALPGAMEAGGVSLWLKKTT